MPKIPNLKINVKPIYIIVIICSLIAITVYFYLPKNIEQALTVIQQTTDKSDMPENKQTIALPFNINQVDMEDGIFSPFGVYRKTGDLIGLGHSGIDIPLVTGAEIYAANSGKIVSITKPADGRPGNNVKIIFDGDKNGNGIGFYYENINPIETMKVGTKVIKGQVFAKNALGKYANTHFQLAYWYNNFEYFKDSTCWINELGSKDKLAITAMFEKQSLTQKFINDWNTVTEEGKFTYKGLLDLEKFPEGPQLCYPPGTDGRITY